MDVKRKNKNRSSLASRIKSNPSVAAALVIGSIIVALAAAVGAVDDMRETILRWVSGETKNTAIGATDDFVTTEEDKDVIIPLLANDIGIADLSQLAIRLDTGTTKGSVKLENKSAAYSPAPNFSGTDTFSYTIEKNGQPSTAVVQVAIQEVNDPPSAPDIHLKLSYLNDGAAVIDLVGTATDVEGDAITLASFSVPETSIPPENALAFARKSAGFLGPMQNRDETKLAGTLYLPIMQWMEEASKQSLTETVTRKLLYTLRDSKGAETSSVATIDIEVQTVVGIPFTCKTSFGQPPNRMTFQLLLDGVSLSKTTAPPTGEWMFFQLSRKLYLSEVNGSTKTQIQAEWDDSDRTFSIQCASKVRVSSGEDVPGSSVTLTGGKGQNRTTDGYFATSPFKQIDSVFGVMYDLLGQPRPKHN